MHLSEIIGTRIYDAQGNSIARVRDLVAELPRAELAGVEGEAPAEGDVPLLKGVLARTGRKRPPFYVPMEQVKSFGPDGVRLNSSSVNLQPFERREGEILLAKDLWDKQIINLENRKVVRVNDIVLDVEPKKGKSGGPGGPRWQVKAIAIGLLGLLYRLRLQNVLKAILHKKLEPQAVSWQHLDVFGSDMSVQAHLKHRKLANLHPVEIARITDAVSYHQGAEIIASLDDTLAADTLEEIVEERQVDILETIPDERAADILEEMTPDEATDLLADMSEGKADTLLGQMDEAEAQEVRQLMRYDENSAGGIMTTDFVSALPDMEVEDVIGANRDTFMSTDLIYYIYVVEAVDTNKLLGIITVRDLLVHDPDDRVGDFMLKEFISVRPGENKKEVARKMAEYNLLALPVVNAQGELLGVVTVDDALDALLPEGWKKRFPRIFS